MERADGRLIDVAWSVVTSYAQCSKSAAHFGSGFASKGDGEYSRWVDQALGNSPGDAMGEHASFSGSCTGVHDGCSWGACDCSSLVVIELREQHLWVHGWQATTTVSRATRRRRRERAW